VQNKKVTSIRIDPRIWKEIRKYAIDTGIGVGEFVEHLLTIFLSPYLEKGKPSFSTARSDFLWEDGLVYFNSGALATNPTRVIGKVTSYLYELGKYGGSSREMCERLEQEDITCRRNLALALGAEVDEILYEANTTRSLRLAFNISKTFRKLSATDKILTTDFEHDSIKHVLFMEFKSKTKEVPLLQAFRKGYDKNEILELFTSAIDHHSKLLFISHIPYLGGKLPVDEIVEIAMDRNPNTICIVDGAHALGQLRIDVKRINCDFYAVNAHKFGLGLPAFGALYANARYLEELSSTRNREKFPIYDSYTVSSKFRTDEELGTINGAAIVSFNEAFRILYDHYGIDRVQTRILSLAKYFVEYIQKDKTLAPVSPMTPELISGVNCFTINNYSYDEYSKLVEVLENKYKIICKALKRPPCIRICLHYFNSENDIDRFFEALRKEAAA